MWCILVSISVWGEVDKELAGEWKAWPGLCTQISHSPLPSFSFNSFQVDLIVLDGFLPDLWLEADMTLLQNDE